MDNEITYTIYKDGKPTSMKVVGLYKVKEKLEDLMMSHKDSIFVAFEKERN